MAENHFQNNRFRMLAADQAAKAAMKLFKAFRKRFGAGGANVPCGNQFQLAVDRVDDTIAGDV